MNRSENGGGLSSSVIVLDVVAIEVDKAGIVVEIRQISSSRPFFRLGKLFKKKRRGESTENQRLVDSNCTLSFEIKITQTSSKNNPAHNAPKIGKRAATKQGNE